MAFMAIIMGAGGVGFRSEGLEVRVSGFRDLRFRGSGFRA